MSHARAMFHAELQEAVRDVQAPRPDPIPLVPPRRRRRTVVRLWLPLSPLWVILAPFALLAAPLTLLASQSRGLRPYRAVFALGGALFALSGTVVDVDTPDALVRIRIF